nr:hypothetical protein [Cressdnaviricota sp.]
MLVGLKINEDVLAKTGLTIKQIAEWFTPHHRGEYVIGRDSMFTAGKPHYHIHFITDSTESAVKAQKSKKLSELKEKGIDTGGRTTKMYIPKEIDSADPEVFLAYATKETVVWRHEKYNNSSFDVKRNTQMEVKKLKHIHSQKQQIKQDEKKEFKDKMFDYIQENYDHYALENDYDIQQTNRTVIMLLMIKYLRENERYGSLQQRILENYYMEYFSKYLGKTDKDIFNLIFKC